MSSPIRLETLHRPVRYTPTQLEHATRIAQALGRGALVLCESPRR